jgi:hypothetical protein
MESDFLDYHGWNLIPVSLLALVSAAAILGHGVVRKTLPPALLVYLGLTLLLLLTRNQTQGALRYLLVVFPVVGSVAGLALVQVVMYLAAMQGALWALT